MPHLKGVHLIVREDRRTKRKGENDSLEKEPHCGSRINNYVEARSPKKQIAKRQSECQSEVIQTRQKNRLRRTSTRTDGHTET